MMYFMRFSEPLEQECEATSFSFRTEYSGSAAARPRREQLREMAFTKKTDSLTSALSRHMMAGTLFRKVAIEVRRDGQRDNYMTYDCGEVGISSLSSTGTTDTVSLVFKRVSVAYSH